MNSPKVTSFVFALSVAAGALFAACQGGGSGAATGCAGLSACCSTLSGTAAAACTEVASAAGVTDDTCTMELSALQSTGQCGTSSAPPPSSSPTAICSLYVDCEGNLDPAGQAAILAAYGPSGTCWETAATTAECGNACESGLQAAHQINPSECPLCGSNADCGASTPICSDGECSPIPFAQSCTTSESCSTGLCTNGTCECGTGETYCGGAANGLVPSGGGDEKLGSFGCVTLSSDVSNCGGCGNACQYPATACSNGTCDCGPGTALCNGRCTDITSDVYNCGGCDKSCGVEDDSCNAGKCGCKSGETVCGGACTDLTYDNNNCGACGVTCSAGDCDSGLCPAFIYSAGSAAGDGGTAGTCDTACAALGDGFSCKTATFVVDEGVPPVCEPSPLRQATTCGTPLSAAPASPCGNSYDSDCTCSHS